MADQPGYGTRNEEYMASFAGPTTRALAVTCTRRWPSRLVSVGLEPGAQFGHVVWVRGEDEGAEALGHHGHVSIDHI